jgi:glycosyltransferase 2 family protein
MALRPLGERRSPFTTISLTVVVGLLTYGAMVWAWADWGAVWASIGDFSLGVWIQVVAGAVLSFGLRFVRWHLLIACLGHHLPWGTHLTIYLCAFALTLTPAKIGETVRSFYLYPFGVSYPCSLSAFVAERLIDLLVVGALASLVVWIFKQHAVWLFTVWGTILITVALFRSQLLTWLSKRWFKGPTEEHLATGSQAIAQLLRGPILFKTVPLTAMAWATQGVGLSVVASALGHDLPVLWAIAIYSLSLLAGAASFIPGGLGATEAAMVLLLMAAGQDLTTATSAALVSRGVPLWLAMGLGTLSMLRLSTVHPHQLGLSTADSKTGAHSTKP